MAIFNVILEQDGETGIWVGYFSGWPGAHSQGASPEELWNHLAEVVLMLHEDAPATSKGSAHE